MDIQTFLTFTIDAVILISLLFLVVDFSFFLVQSWQQLDPSTKPDFYQQVKDLLRNDDAQLGIFTT